jgi:urate oxidase
MPAHLVSHSYGKSRVRLTKVTRGPQQHDLKEMTVDITLEGAFDACYTCGDNSSVVATDSMKNTVYVLAREHPVDSIESFGLHLAEHFLKTYDHVTAATASIGLTRWDRIHVDGKPHAYAFVGGGDERRTAEVRVTREGRSVTSGLTDLLVLKTTDSGFVGFVRDRYTTLRETDDRIFATSVTANWICRPDIKVCDWNAQFERVRQLILETFATHKSLAVQQTIHEIGDRVLASLPEVDEIAITMPNKHRILVDLSPFGLDNNNEIFVPIDEPYGLIRGVLCREKAST